MKQLKPKFCKNCLDQFQPYKSTDKWCSPQCYYVWVGNQEINKKVKQMKVSIKFDNSFSTLQTLVNKIVRLIDRGHPCISSGTPYGKYQVDAGHFYSVGSNPTLRYNLLNIFAQSRSDNDRKGGKGSNYGLSLKQTFGDEVRDEIESLPAKYPRLNLSKMEAWEACKRARNVIKALEQTEVIFTNEMRITMRKRINESLGIYKN